MADEKKNKVPIFLENKYLPLACTYLFLVYCYFAPTPLMLSTIERDGTLIPSLSAVYDQ